MNKKKLILVSLLALTIIVMITAFSTASTAWPTVQARNNTVVIQDNRFNPAEITIKKGESITWYNQDSIGHNARGKIFGTTFNSGLLGNEELNKPIIFNEVGTFEYQCTLHADMKGTIIVI